MTIRKAYLSAMILLTLAFSGPARALNDSTTVPDQTSIPNFAKPGDFAGAFILQRNVYFGGFGGYLIPISGRSDDGPYAGNFGDWYDLENGTTYTLRCTIANVVTGRCACPTPTNGRTIVQFSPPHAKTEVGPYYRAMYCYYQS
jgi:hypothetical protein